MVNKELAKIINENIPAVLAIVVDVKGSSPGKLSSKMIITADGSTLGTIGGGKLEYEVIDEAKKIFKSGNPKILRFYLDESYGYQCGGEVAIYLEPLNIYPHLIIFGAGHVGKAVTEIFKYLHFKVTVIDDREELLNAIENADVDKILVPDYQSSFSKLNINENSYILIVTRDHTFDLELTKMSLSTPAKYIGVIGSKRKSKYILDTLRKDGYNDDEIKRVYTPVGIPIKTDTPYEIAISIAAQIIDISKKK
jgi:xanthine dehydrogenase accessory factor